MEPGASKIAENLNVVFQKLNEKGTSNSLEDGVYSKEMEQQKL
jgi:hypothetical protein